MPNAVETLRQNVQQETPDEFIRGQRHRAIAFGAVMAIIFVAFGLDELGARIRKVLRRDIWRRGEAPCFSSPSLQIDLVFRHIHRSGRTHSLSRRQFQLLKLLLDADGRVLMHRDLIRAIWGDDDGGRVALLRKVVQDLRRKIEPNPRQPVHILSHSRIGYRFDRSQH